MQNYIRSHLVSLALSHLIFQAVLAQPGHRLCPCQAGKALNFYLVSNHEGRIETQAKVTNHRLTAISSALVFLHIVHQTRISNLVYVPVNLFSGHPNTLVTNGQGVSLCIQFYFNTKFLVSRGSVAQQDEVLALTNCVNRVRNQFSQKDFFFCIEPLFNNRKNIF